MELRHLRYFAALAERLSFTQAAERVHVTQSTLSHQIKQLEDELGQRLFDRVGKKVVITESGELLLPSVTRALREIDAAVRAMHDPGRQLSGYLRIAATHTVNINLVPTCLATFLSRHPSVKVTVEELPARTIEQKLRSGDLDLGIAYRPSVLDELRFEPLYEEEMVLAVSVKHTFAARKRVRMLELHRQPIVLLTQEFATRTMLDDWFRSVGAEPVVIVEINAIAPMLALVGQMDIAAVVPESALPDITELRKIAIESPTPVRVPGLLSRPDGEKTTPVKTFATVVRKVVLQAGLRPNRPPGAL
jgi:LysR family transcriptional regulator, cyn operon transcriptional activator